MREKQYGTTRKKSGQVNYMRHRVRPGNPTGFLGAAEYKIQSVEENGETLAQELSNSFKLRIAPLVS